MLPKDKRSLEYVKGDGGKILSYKSSWSSRTGTCFLKTLEKDCDDVKMFWKYLFCKKNVFLCSNMELLKVCILEKENSTFSLERSFPF